MSFLRKDLYTVAGLALIVGAFFAAAKAIGAILALIFFLVTTDFSDAPKSMSENVFNTWKANQMGGLVHAAGSFFILLKSGAPAPCAAASSR